MEGKSIDNVSLDEMPNYELKLVSRTQETNEEEIMIALFKPIPYKNTEHKMKKRHSRVFLNI